MESQILVAHANPQALRPLLQILADCKCVLLTAHTVTEAQHLLGSQVVRAAFCESHLPEGGCAELLRWCKHAGITTPLIASPSTANESEYIELMAKGAFDYIVPPYRRADVELLLRRRECRVELNVPVHIYGIDHAGFPFLQLCFTRNVSGEGACLTGIKHKLLADSIIGISCNEKQGHLRVVWVRNMRDGGYEIGVQVIGSIDEIWFWQVPNI